MNTSNPAEITFKYVWGFKQRNFYHASMSVSVHR